MKAEERIIEEAREYALRNCPAIAETYSVNSYMAGAKTERNKTIEEVKILHQRYLNLQIGTEGTSFEQLLESLKV